jgi:hypothetical protein
MLDRTNPVQERFENQGAQLRALARETPPGVERFLLVRKARRAEAKKKFDERKNIKQ